MYVFQPNICIRYEQAMMEADFFFCSITCIILSDCQHHTDRTFQNSLVSIPSLHICNLYPFRLIVFKISGYGSFCADRNTLLWFQDKASSIKYLQNPGIKYLQNNTAIFSFLIPSTEKQDPSNPTHVRVT